MPIGAPQDSSENRPAISKPCPACPASPELVEGSPAEGSEVEGGAKKAIHSLILDAYLSGQYLDPETVLHYNMHRCEKRVAAQRY